MKRLTSTVSTRVARVLAALVLTALGGTNAIAQSGTAAQHGVATQPGAATQPGMAPPPEAAKRAGGAAQHVKASQLRWEQSAHGEMLRRIIPPGIAPAQLPEPKSRGARLTAHYCVQCHHLAPPAMHHAAKWPAIVERMLPRMEGRGNMGAAMKDLMAGVQAPGADETRAIVSYLQKHAQKHIDIAALPEAARKTHAWVSYVQACSQCHVAPDPKRYRGAQWPRVVARMEDHMGSMNRVVGSRANPAEPQYRSEEIIAYLRRHARP